MQAFKIQAVVTSEHMITLKVPFSPGDPVEVIVLGGANTEPVVNPYPLRGTLVRYDDPTEPVAENDWEAAK